MVEQRLGLEVNELVERRDGQRADLAVVVVGELQCLATDAFHAAC
jgi:hypothetical protein